LFVAIEMGKSLGVVPLVDKLEGGGKERRVGVTLPDTNHEKNNFSGVKKACSIAHRGSGGRPPESIPKLPPHPKERRRLADPNPRHADESRPKPLEGGGPGERRKD